MESIGNPAFFASGEPWSRNEGNFELGQSTPPLMGERYGGMRYGASQAGEGTSGMPGFGMTNDPASMLAEIRNAMFGLFAQLSDMMHRLAGQSCGQEGNGTRGCEGASVGGQRYFTNATLSSVGDPHDTLMGTLDTGQTEQRSWDSMRPHANLISSASIPGGFNVSTQVTAPDAKGITYNAQATITTNHGMTSVTMDRNGGYHIFNDGMLLSPTPGTSMSLGNGQTVTVNGNGSLSFTALSATGGSIATTLSSNGNGVDVSAKADDVLLGGYLAEEGTHVA